eukprot:5123485-Pleurochrysis_carterae.AAC.1
MRQARSEVIGPLPLPTSTCWAMRQKRSLTSSLRSRLRRVHVKRLPSLPPTTLRHSRPPKPTNCSPPCSLIVRVRRRSRDIAGTLSASGLPRGCSAQAVRPTSFKPSAGGSRP